MLLLFYMEAASQSSLAIIKTNNITPMRTKLQTIAETAYLVERPAARERNTYTSFPGHLLTETRDIVSNEG